LAAFSAGNGSDVSMSLNKISGSDLGKRKLRVIETGVSTYFVAKLFYAQESAKNSCLPVVALRMHRPGICAQAPAASVVEWLPD